jgi:hypothetical protein
MFVMFRVATVVTWHGKVAIVAAATTALKMIIVKLLIDEQNMLS